MNSKFKSAFLMAALLTSATLAMAIATTSLAQMPTVPFDSHIDPNLPPRALRQSMPAAPLLLPPQSTAPQQVQQPPPQRPPANAQVKYDPSSVHLLNVVEHCRKDFRELSRTGIAATAYHEATPNHYDRYLPDNFSYFITFATQPMPPSMRRHRVGELIITAQFQPSSVKAPDVPVGAWVYTCRITK